MASSNSLADIPHIVADISNGDIYSEKNIDDRWYPASLTKLMTAYVTFEAIRNREIQSGSPVTISKLATRQPPSKMGYRQGIQLRVDTALKIIIVKSANDVSVALAEAVAGSVDGFVGRMNQTAKELGMQNSRFANPHGLHSTDQFTSARDMAILTAAIWRQYPQYRFMFESVGVKTPKKLHYSYNLLLERFTGTTGMKTGFVCASGYNMVASAERNNRHLVAVVLGTGSQTDRAVSSAKLLNTAFLSRRGPIGNLALGTQQGRSPVNMRPLLCTEKARKARYEPGAGQAKIKSEFLQPRVRSSAILDISTGGIDSEPSAAYMARKFQPSGRIPIPGKRPNYVIVDVDGVQISSSLALRGTLPIPSQRPANN